MQSLLDTVTRCFNPLEVSPGGCVASPCASHVRPSADGQPPQQQRDTSSSSAKSSRSSRRGGREPATPHQYDPDRYIHRKLEIFRARSDDDEVDRRIVEAQRRATGRRKKRGQDELAYSSDEIDELTRQAARQDRTQKKPKKDTPSESPFGVLNLICATGTAPFLGLCFATPVRSPSREDVSTLSDWKLTAEEFEARRRAQAEAEAAIACHADVKRCLYDSGDENLQGIPHVEESSASSVVGEGEEETITSASYFEAKYSHVVQTTPPMPLYDENRILVSESRDGEILRLVERRKEQRRRARGGGGGGRTTPPDSKRTTPPRSNPPQTISTPTATATPDPTPRRKGGHSRSGSLGSLSNRAAKTSKSASGGGKEASKSKTKRHRRRLSFGKGKRHEVPMTKSSTVSEASASGVDDREGNMSIRTVQYEPEIVHSTAEI